MLNTYRLTLAVTCPIDGQVIPTVVTVAADGPVIKVEDLRRICTDIVAVPMLQEDFTEALMRALADRYPGDIEVETEAVHSSVEVTCRV